MFFAGVLLAWAGMHIYIFWRASVLGARDRSPPSPRCSLERGMHFVDELHRWINDGCVHFDYRPAHRGNYYSVNRCSAHWRGLNFGGRSPGSRALVQRRRWS